MDVTPFLEPKIAPRAVFDSLAERRTKARFMMSDGDAWRAVTWEAFADQIRAAALFLAGAGIVPGDRVAVFAQNRVEWLAAALGAQAAGAVLVPIYPASTADQAAYIAAHCDAAVVFADAALFERIRERRSAYAGVKQFVLFDDVEVDVERVTSWARAVALGHARHAEDPRAFDARMDAVRLDDVGLMLYTSGTTGDPKGVPLTHRNVAVNGRDWLTIHGAAIAEQSVDLLWLPFSHIFGFGEACLGNTLGFTSYLSDPARALAHLPAVRPNVFMSVPAYWDKLAKGAMAEPDADARRRRLAELTGGRLAFCLSGGAGLALATKEFFQSAGVLIVEGYGLTECSPTLTLNRAGDYRFDAVGKPLLSVELRLADDGEILARGPSVFAGYHKDEAATRAAFTDDGWFKTGDVGRFTEDGFLQIVDRKKEILVTAGGKNVPPANIEQRLAANPIVQHAVVYGDGKSYLTAGIWLNPDAVDARLRELATRREPRVAGIDALLPPTSGTREAGPTSDAARAETIAALVAAHVDAVNATLARYEQIKKHRIMDTPLTVARGLVTSTLKIRRKAIYAAFGADFEAMYA
jgi:long-chain acyl-CoA synthetase